MTTQMATVTSTGTNPPDAAASRNQVLLRPVIPVSQTGCFEFDRVLKSGKVQKRAQKTRAWKPAYLVLRPNTLYVYKNANEEKLRHKIYLTDITAVAPLKDPKNKRDHVFGLFLSSRNFHFQAPSAKEAEEWLELIRKEARIDEEDEELYLASPLASRQSSTGAAAIPEEPSLAHPLGGDWALSSSPEGIAGRASLTVPNDGRLQSQMPDSSGLSGNELASHSDFSDTDARRPRGASVGAFPARSRHSRDVSHPTGHRAQASLEQDLDRVVWQGRLLFLRSKGGVRQWKKTWGVLRPRNFILYRDESEYAAKLVVPLSSVVNVVDIDPMGSKAHCLQLITEERNYRFCAAGEEELVQCLGAFKSLLTKRKELEERIAAVTGGAGKGAVAAPTATATANATPPAAKLSSSPPPPSGAHMVLPTR